MKLKAYAAIADNTKLLGYIRKLSFLASMKFSIKWFLTFFQIGFFYCPSHKHFKVMLWTATSQGRITNDASCLLLRKLLLLKKSIGAKVSNVRVYISSKLVSKIIKPTSSMRDSDCRNIRGISCGAISFRSLLSWVFVSCVKE